jgi:hypothetical protein
MLTKRDALLFGFDYRFHTKYVTSLVAGVASNGV